MTEIVIVTYFLVGELSRSHHRHCKRHNCPL